MSGIYAWLNLINEKIYVGSAKNFYKRYHTHKSKLLNNKHDNSYLQRGWNKYGQINFMFVLIEYCELDKLIEREQFYIDALNPEYNLRPTANNMLGYVHSEESKRKNSNAKKNKPLTEAHKKTLSEKSANRDKEKWPHKGGARCQCEECRAKWTLRNREHSKEWRSENREKYNKYMREYNSRKD